MKIEHRTGSVEKVKSGKDAAVRSSGHEKRSQLALRPPDSAAYRDKNTTAQVAPPRIIEKMTPEIAPPERTAFL